MPTTSVSALTRLGLHHHGRAQHQHGGYRSRRTGSESGTDARPAGDGNGEPSEVDEQGEQVTVEQEEPDCVKHRRREGIEGRHRVAVLKRNTAQPARLHEPGRRRQVVPEGVSRLHPGSERANGANHPRGEHDRHNTSGDPVLPVPSQHRSATVDPGGRERRSASGHNPGDEPDARHVRTNGSGRNHPKAPSTSLTTTAVARRGHRSITAPSSPRSGKMRRRTLMAPAISGPMAAMRRGMPRRNRPYVMERQGHARFAWREFA